MQTISSVQFINYKLEMAARNVMSLEDFIGDMHKREAVEVIS
jgi:hypothetical protein